MCGGVGGNQGGTDRQSDRHKGSGVKGEGGRSEEREIITTELVAGADFFHHLP